MATPEIKSKAELEAKISGDQTLNKLRESVKAETDSQRKVAAYKDFLKAFNPTKSPENVGYFRITIAGSQYDVSESILEQHASDVLQLQDVDLKAVVDASGKETIDVIATFKQELNPLLETISTSPDQGKQSEVFAALQRQIDDQKAMKEEFEKFLITNTPTDAQSDVKQLLDLGEKVEAAKVSNQSLFAGAIGAGSLAALTEQNTYLREQIAGYQEKGAKYEIKKFKPKNSKAQQDIQYLVDQFGTADQKKAFANILDSNASNEKKENGEVAKEIDTNKNAQKSVEQMTDAEKKTFLKNLIAGLDVAMTNKKQSVDAATGEVYIDLNKEEYQQFMMLQALTAKANDGKSDVNEVYDRDMNDKPRKKTIKQLEREISREQKKSRDMKKIAGLEEQLARLRNDTNYFTNRANVTHGISEVLKTGKYLGQTIEYEPRSPLFVNICQSLDALSTTGVIQVNFAGNPNVLVRCPEMLNDKTGTYVDKFGKRFASKEDAAYCKENGVRTPNILENFFTKNTKMTPEQARRNASLLSTGGLLAGLFFGIQWLVSKDKSGKTNFMGRAAIVAGSILGVNMLSQGMTGRSFGDIVKDIWSGKLSFSDIMAGKGFGAEVKSPQLTVAGIALNGVSYEVLSKCAKESSNGYPTIDFNLLEKALEAKLLLATGADKDKLQQQLDAVKELHKDHKGQQYIDQALADLGIKQSDLADPTNKDKTVDTKVEDAQERVRKLSAYEQEKHLKIKDMRDASVISYMSTGKPTLDELAKDGKFRSDTQKIGVDGVSEAQRNIDPELAQAELPDDVALALDDAMNKVNGTIDFKVANNRPTFLSENGKLYVRSYGLNTPISLQEGNYKVGTLDIGLPGAQEAIKTANLINFLIMANNGQRDNDTPFAFSGKDITVGNDGIFGRKWLDSKLSGIKQKYYNGTAVDGPDFKRWPWSSSTLEDIGGIQLNSQGGKFATYLNGLKNASGQSIWKNGQGISSTSEIVGFAAGLGAMPKRKIEKPTTNKDNTDDSEDNKETTKKPAQKKKSSGGGTSTESIGSGKKEVATVSVEDRATRLKNKFKDAAGANTPDAFYTDWAKAMSGKALLFVSGGKIYERVIDKNEAPKEYSTGDSGEVLEVRQKTVAAGKEFKNLGEALLAGDVVMTGDNKEEATPKEGYEFVAPNTCNYAVKVKGGTIPSSTSPTPVAPVVPGNTPPTGCENTEYLRISKNMDFLTKEGDLRTPERPDDYEGSVSIADSNAKIEDHTSYMTLYSHNEKIDIQENPNKKGKRQIGYVNPNTGVNMPRNAFLNLDFESPEAALKVGTLVNFFRDVYKGQGTDDTSFNISYRGNDLEFAEDGTFDGIDLAAMGSKAITKYSEVFRNTSNLSIFKNRLNSMPGFEA